MTRRALFVGVDEYDDPQIRDLRFSRIDAHSLNDLFADVGYDVKYLPNPTKAEVLAAVRERTSGLAAGDSFFFYFAGHGFTQGGHDLLFCRDDVYEDLRFDDAGLKFEKLRQRTETGSGYDRVFVLDACRSDFLTGTRGAATYARDLAPAKNLVKDVTPKTGSLAVLRSCSPYQYALEVESRQHGLFTCAFIDVMRTARREGTRLAFDESFGDAVAKTMTAIARNAHLPNVEARYPKLRLFAVSAVDKTVVDASGHENPARDFRPSGIGELGEWIVSEIKRMSAARKEFLGALREMAEKKTATPTSAQPRPVRQTPQHSPTSVPHTVSEPTSSSESIFSDIDVSRAVQIILGLVAVVVGLCLLFNGQKWGKYLAFAGAAGLSRLAK